MKESAKISSLRELRKRREEVEAEMAASKQELIMSIKPTSLQARDLVLKDVILPLVGAGIAVYAISRLFSGRKKDTKSSYTEATAKEPYTGSEPAKLGIYTNGNGNGSHQNYAKPNRGGMKPKSSKSRMEALIKFGSLVVPAARAIMAAVKENQD